jgi:hypothetical protein
MHRSGYFDRESLQRVKKLLQRGTMSRRPASAGVSSKTYGAYGAYGEMESAPRGNLPLLERTEDSSQMASGRETLVSADLEKSVASISESEKKKPPQFRKIQAEIRCSFRCGGQTPLQFHTFEPRSAAVSQINSSRDPL